MFIHCHSRISPPQESLRNRRRIVQFSFYFKISFSGIKRKPGHPFLVKHFFVFAYPNSYASISIILNGMIYRQKSARAMMLWPVELNTARNPRTGKSYQCRLNYLIIINEMTLFYFVIGHLHTTAQLGQNHHPDIFIFQKNSVVNSIVLFVFNFLHYRIGINYTAASLINTFFQKNRIFFRFTGFVGWDNNILVPTEHLTPTP